MIELIAIVTLIQLYRFCCDLLSPERPGKLALGTVTAVLIVLVLLQLFGVAHWSALGTR